MGEPLLKQVVKGTGLPEDLISNEIEGLRRKAGMDEGDLTLEDLRKLVASYLQDVLVDVKDRFSNGVFLEDVTGEEEKCGPHQDESQS